MIWISIWPCSWPNSSDWQGAINPVSLKMYNVTFSSLPSVLFPSTFLSTMMLRSSLKCRTIRPCFLVVPLSLTPPYSWHCPSSLFLITACTTTSQRLQTLGGYWSMTHSCKFNAPHKCIFVFISYFLLTINRFWDVTIMFLLSNVILAYWILFLISLLNLPFFVILLIM